MARQDIPRWVISALALWGRQKRRVWIGQDWHGNIDGYASSLLGRIRDERDGTGQGARKQYWPEVFWGAGLDVQRGIHGMAGAPFCVLHLHYVFLPEWQITITRKAQYLGISKADYWRELENGETWTHAKLDSVSDCPPMEKHLRLVSKSTTTQSQSAKVAKVSLVELNLTALNRNKLALA